MTELFELQNNVDKLLVDIIQLQTELTRIKSDLTKIKTKIDTITCPSNHSNSILTRQHYRVPVVPNTLSDLTTEEFIRSFK